MLLTAVISEYLTGEPIGMPDPPVIVVVAVVCSWSAPTSVTRVAGLASLTSGVAVLFWLARWLGYAGP
jgi:hypothetical protein